MIWLGAWRVNGNLSVSRAIGDAKDKTFISGEADTVSCMYPPYSTVTSPLSYRTVWSWMVPRIS